jgi:dTDP-4-dehydrorhamnose reductase
MRLLVTGAAGMLGVDVVAAARGAGHEVTPLGRTELDITDPAAVSAAVGAATPDAVINCAAFTDVDGAETETAAAQAINGEGAGHVASAAAAHGAWVVHVSTDYVFDGTGDRPYVESDPVGPRSAYGATKLAGERAVVAAAPDAHTIVRTAWLFGTAGRCFPRTIAQLAAERDELTVVADQVGCPTFTGHLAPALVTLAERRSVLGLAHVAGGGQCSWFEFAREIVARSGASCEVRPVGTVEFPRPAPRPAWSVLGTERGDLVPRLADWRAGLEEYMQATVLTS